MTPCIHRHILVMKMHTISRTILQMNNNSYNGSQNFKNHRLIQFIVKYCESLENNWQTFFVPFIRRILAPLQTRKL